MGSGADLDAVNVAQGRYALERGWVDRATASLVFQDARRAGTSFARAAVATRRLTPEQGWHLEAAGAAGPPAGGGAPPGPGASAFAPAAGVDAATLAASRAEPATAVDVAASRRRGGPGGASPARGAAPDADTVAAPAAPEAAPAEVRALVGALPGEGSRLGGYVLERKLGQGGMGAVFVGRRDPGDVRHAIKVMVLAAGGKRHGEQAERFAREARALAKLPAHPGVVRIHDFGADAGVAFIALELVDGRDLKAALEAGALELPRALRLGEGIARALAHVHAANVVHRDLKPANVLLRGGTDEPVLTDFGVARNEDDQRMTASQQVVGTPHYMAPEQATGKRARIGPRTDVFSLGVLLYEVLTGERPFEGGNLAELTGAILLHTPPAPSTLRPDLPRDLDTVVLRALEKDPDQRPSADEVAAALAAIGAGEAIALRRRGSLERVVAGLRRQRRVVTLAATGLALVVVAVAGGSIVLRERHLAQQWERDASLALEGAGRARDAYLAALRAHHVDGAPAPDAAALGSACAAVRDVLERPQGGGAPLTAELAGAQVDLGHALAQASVHDALARGDLAAARARLAAAGPARAFLEALLAARTPGEAGLVELERLAQAETLRGLERALALLLAARRAVDAAYAQPVPDAQVLARAQRLVGAVPPDPVVATARRRLEGRLLGLDAAARARALDADGCVAALRAAVERGGTLEPVLLAARAALTRFDARFDARPDGGGDALRVAALLDALATAFPQAPLPREAAAAYLAAADARQGARDWAGVVACLDGARRADPNVRPRAELGSTMMLEGQLQLAQGNLRAGYQLVLFAARTGWVDSPITRQHARDLWQSGVAEAFVREHPDDWAGRYTYAKLCQLAIKSENSRAQNLAIARRGLDEATRALAAPNVPPLIRTDALFLQLKFSDQLEPGSHLPRIEAALAAGFPDPWRLCEFGAREALSSGTPEAGLLWARRLVEATEVRIEESRAGTVPPGARPILDAALEREHADQQVVEALYHLGRLDEASAQIDAMAGRGARPEHVAVLRARFLSWCRRWPEALEAAERLLRQAPGNVGLMEIRAISLRELGDPRAAEALDEYEAARGARDLAD